MRPRRCVWNKLAPSASVSSFILCTFVVLHLLSCVDASLSGGGAGDTSGRVRRAKSKDTDPVVATALRDLKSEKMNKEVVDKLGTTKFKRHGQQTVIDRIRRDHRDEQFHEQKAEADSIAAAAEAAAAEADSVAAAVEVSEALETGGDQNENGITFEENESGDMIALEQDSREQAHGGYSGNGFAYNDPALYPTNADVRRDREFDAPNAWSSGAGTGTSVDWGSDLIRQVDQSSTNVVEELSQTADVKTPISQLLLESKDLAHEIRLVFQVLAKREEYLVNEMEKLKKALASAIQVLQENNEVSKLVRLKRGNEKAPHKACVYITPADWSENKNRVDQQDQLTDDRQRRSVQQQHSEGGGSGGEDGSNDIDLTSVYWLKLPASGDVGVSEKIHRIVTQMRGSGRDLLIIPVGRGYTTQQDLARGFLRAVRVENEDQTQKLRIRIRRV